MVYETTTLEQNARDLLEERGVTIKDIAELVFFLQKIIFLNWISKYAWTVLIVY